MSEPIKLTPLLEQYFNIKNAHQDALLLFQVGDFYELFFDDAKIASQALSITLTKRGKCQGEDIPICGVPVSSLSYHLVKLVKQGFKVAICDQVSKPIPGEIVERKVSRVLTPGTLTDDLMLDQKKTSFLCSLWPLGEQWSILFADLLGANIFATSFAANDWKVIESELARFFPEEILLPDLQEVISIKKNLEKKGLCINYSCALGKKHNSSDNSISLNDYLFNHNSLLKEFLEKMFHPNLAATCKEKSETHGCLAVLVSYLENFHSQFFSQVDQINFYKPDDYLVLDAATLKNLEIFKNNYDSTTRGSLFATIDKCKTNMGSRALRQAIMFPLQNKEIILARQEFIGHLKNSFLLQCKLENLLAELSDLERIVGRIGLGKAQLADFIALKQNLETYEKIINCLTQMPESALKASWFNNLPNTKGLGEILNSSIEDKTQENKIKQGFDFTLDHLRAFRTGSNDTILELEQQEIARTNISNLRIKYTDIHGYFFEISFKELQKVPEDYKLLQSLAGRSRFTTTKLKTLEMKIFTIEQEIKNQEDLVFAKIVSITQGYLSDLRKIAYVLSNIDMLFGLAKIAYDYNLCCPKIVENDCLIIIAGRHLVVESLNQFNFVPNNSELDQEKRLMIITGPNMGGKSTYLRQVGHITLLAHLGSFVPAKECSISIVDRIFTRIGSADHMAAGKSTFLVEMEEVALICNSATNKSLIILDEVGRGTSTFDGMAIAWAILNFLHLKIKAKILFATHYHELTNLTKQHSGIGNFFMSCQEKNDTLTFLHKLSPGVAKSSFGISVAKMAGIPKNIIEEAREILKSLPDSKQLASPINIFPATKETEELSIKKTFQNEIINQLTNLDLEDISFKQAYNILEQLKSKIM